MTNIYMVNETRSRFVAVQHLTVKQKNKLN